MKKTFLLMSLLAAGLSLNSCSDSSDNNSSTDITEDEAQNLDYTSDNAAAWGNYAVNVARLLANDSKALYTKWANEYAEGFKNHNRSVTGYSTALECVEEIIDGSIDIASEVGTQKIGEPVGYWNSGQRTKALYAVESWYSFHSREDYMNNILSVANAFLGVCIDIDNNVPLTDSYKQKADPNSIYAKGIANSSMAEQTATVWNSIVAAHNAIYRIPNPFRNNIGSDQAVEAMQACADLTKNLEGLNALIEEGKMTEEDAQAIATQFVDAVVMPTYKNLVEKNNALQTAVNTFQKSPSNATFEAACNAWMAARKPWESSEAFLFGPVAELGLDPNMDSWPLDAVGIANLLKSQKWSEMEWTGDYEEPDEDDADNSTAQAKAIEAAQALRGFHTLEYLLFKNGKPRTVK